MGQIKKGLDSERVKYQDVAFKFFAVVGFLSSLVTLASWLFATQASLTAVITPTTIELPDEVRLPSSDINGYDLSNAINDLTDRFCEQVEVDYRGEQARNYNYDSSKCERSQEFFRSISTIAELAGKKILAWDLVLENDGQDVAENIILRTTVPVSVRGADMEGNPIDIEATASDKVFSIPNINPNESYNIRIISATPVPERYDVEINEPRVTFSGGVVDKRTNILVSGRYSRIVDYLDDLPTVMQIIVIGFGACVITMFWLLPLAMISDASSKQKKKRSEQSEISET